MRYNRRMVTLKVREAKSLKEKYLGLMGKKTSYSLLLKTRFGIHTFAMKFPIDVVILNKENIVVKIKENLLPNRLFFWNPRYDTILELPQGTIKKDKITTGSAIKVLVQ